VRILLDECIDRRFARELPRHEVRTVPEAGWAGKSNGELLALAENSFDVFVTVAQNYGLNDRQIRAAEALIRKHENDIRSAWRRHFGR
jgi:hypothetical protein